MTTTRPADPAWLRTLLMHGDRDHRPDAELLERFAQGGEQTAFEALLRRHGPLVWGVCRRTLPNPADADDAFQATFLIFVQKARTVRDGGRLGPWLYGVALRVARRARQRAGRDATSDTTASLPAREPADGIGGEWLARLDEAIDRLPAKYRDAIVLCELQGLSRADGAAKLGLAEGTLSSRLARGRLLLKKRLARFGTPLPAVAALATATAPASLLGRVAETVAQYGAMDGLPAGAVPAGVAVLTQEVIHAMFLMKLKVGTLLALTATAATIGLAAADPGKKRKAKADTPVAADVAKPDAARTDAADAELTGDLKAMQGLWHFRELPKDPTDFCTCYVRGDILWMIRTRDNGYATRYRIWLDSNKNPKWINLADADDPGAGISQNTMRGIYQVSGDKLDLAMSATNAPFRVTDFEFRASDMARVYGFVKSKNTEGTLAALEKAGVSSMVSGTHRAKNRAELLGQWTATRQITPSDDGKQIAEWKGGRVEITPAYVFVEQPGKSRTEKTLWQAAEYSIDPEKSPSWINLLFGPPPGSDVAQWGYGIYDGSGDTLRIAYRLNAPSYFRKMDFSGGIEVPLSKSGKEQRSPVSGLLELRRTKP